MQDTATIIAHIMFRHGAILNISTVLRNLDLCLDRASNGAYALAWDSEDVMVANFAQTQVMLVAGHQQTPRSCFNLTIAVSPKDEDALANPALSRRHAALIQDLVAHFEQPLNAGGVLWQRAQAPITVEAVEQIAEALNQRLSLIDDTCNSMPVDASTLETAQLLPASATALQFAEQLPI